MPMLALFFSSRSCAQLECVRSAWTEERERERDLGFEEARARGSSVYGDEWFAVKSALVIVLLSRTGFVLCFERMERCRIRYSAGASSNSRVW